jgi:hypothetical protein
LTDLRGGKAQLFRGRRELRTHKHQHATRFRNFGVAVDVRTLGIVRIVDFSIKIVIDPVTAVVLFGDVVWTSASSVAPKNISETISIIVNTIAAWRNP